VTSCAEAPTANMDSPIRRARSRILTTTVSFRTVYASVSATLSGSVRIARRTEFSSRKRRSGAMSPLSRFGAAATASDLRQRNRTKAGHLTCREVDHHCGVLRHSRPPFGVDAARDHVYGVVGDAVIHGVVLGRMARRHRLL